MSTTRPLRIALVTESCDPRLTGAAATVRQVGDRLVASGHEVRLFTAGAGPATYHSVEIDRFGPPGRKSKIRESLREFGPDLLHAFTPGVMGTKALRGANRLAIPAVVTETSARAEFASPRWREQVADRADRLTVTASWLGERLEAASVAADVWQPGVDSRVFHPGRRSPALRATWTDGDLTQVVVGYVGSLRKRHGIRRLAEVSGLPGIRLVVVGDGPQRAWLGSRLPRAVRFTGELKPREASSAIASLDVLVQPSTRSTCAHALREAAACGVPVVAPAAGGALDVVEHLGTGYLYEPGRRLALADAVAAVVRDQHRQLLGAHGRERITRRSWADAVDELVRDHYTPLLGGALSKAA